MDLSDRALQSHLPENPARLSAPLAELFPANVVATELTADAPRTVLTAAELQFIKGCADKRIDDFTRGRACAHRALRELGVEDFSLLAGPQREPLWPAAIIGSITHTHGMAAAVAARQRDLRAVGVDCEVVDAVDEELWSRICTDAEVERLSQLAPTERVRQAALIFAAKEAFYKCQFPLTHAWVGFEDVVIEPLDWPAASGRLRIIPCKELPVPVEFVSNLVGRFQFRGAWVITGVTAPN